MGNIEEYLERAKELAEDAGEVAKKAAGEVVSRAKELTEEGSKARELMKEAKGLTDEGGKVRELAKEAREGSAALAFGAKEKVQGMIEDARSIKELKQGIAELEALPEIEGSIVFTMEKETLVNSLRGLSLLISDKRLDEATVEDEIRKVMAKIQPAEGASAGITDTSAATQASDTPEAGTDGAAQADAAPASDKTEEELAIEKARAIAYSACIRALGK